MDRILTFCLSVVSALVVRLSFQRFPCKSWLLCSFCVYKLYRVQTEDVFPSEWVLRSEALLPTFLGLLNLQFHKYRHWDEQCGGGCSRDCLIGLAISKQYWHDFHPLFLKLFKASRKMEKIKYKVGVGTKNAFQSYPS